MGVIIVCLFAFIWHFCCRLSSILQDREAKLFKTERYEFRIPKGDVEEMSGSL